MKKTFKVLVSIAALGVVILLVFHLVMLYGLTSAMRKVVLPQLKEQTGIDARVGGLSINIAKGMMFLNDVEIKNPEGFLLENLASVDRIEVEVDIPSLFKQKLIRVKRVEIDNALVNVIRNQDGDINVTVLQEGLPPAQPVGEPVPDIGTDVETVPGEDGEPGPDIGSPDSGTIPEPGLPAPPEEPAPIQEMVIDALLCRAKVHYIDFRLNQLDIALDLRMVARGLSTQLDPATPWGTVDLVGALGNDKGSFRTDLDLRLAPITDPQVLSFDLTGKILEIDPRIMQKLYEELGIRSDPFGFEPRFQCRENQFRDSQMALILNNVQLDKKLAKKLGGMGLVESLRFVVPVEGSLEEPSVDFKSAFMGAVGGNTRAILDAWLKGAAAEEAGLEEPPETVSEAVVEILGEKIEEIGENEELKKVLKDLADGEPSATNAPPSSTTDTIVDILGEEVDEIGENEVLKQGLKDLGRMLFGD